jgi:hypothetical protein
VHLFSCSSCMVLFYLLLIYYTLTKSLLYSVPAVCNLTNPYYPIPTAGSMGGWVKVPGHYSSIPRAPPWQQRTGIWSIQQLIQHNIHKKINHYIHNHFRTHFATSRVTVQTTVFQDPVRIFNPG